MSDKTIRCPSCSTELSADGIAPRDVLLCPVCQTQFYSTGANPLGQMSQLAMASLVLGVASLLCNLYTGIPSIILGVAALIDLRREGSKGRRRGKPLAVAGIALSVLTFMALCVVTLLYFRGTFERQWVRLNEVDQTVQNNRQMVAILDRDAPWKYFHPTDGVDPAEEDAEFLTRFADPDFDDSDWIDTKPESFEQGFGYGDEVATDIGRPESGDRFTAYFRCHFSTSGETYENLTLSMFRDDGVIIYLDGQEVARDNMPALEDDFYLMSANRISGAAETEVITISLTGRLAPGEHVLAISLHNAVESSSDLRIGRIELMGKPVEPGEAAQTGDRLEAVPR